MEATEAPPEAEHYYTEHMCWVPGTFGDARCEPGPVIDLKVEYVHPWVLGGKRTPQYTYRRPGDPQIYRCHYRWAFIKNTPQARLNYARVQELREMAAQLGREADALLKSIQTDLV